METLKLKICHYLYCKSHIHLSVLRKTNAKSEKRTEFWTNANMKRRLRDRCFYYKCFSIPIGKILDKNCESLYWW